MARIFISFTALDQQWERWLTARLRTLGHEPLSHADFPGGLHILNWMHENISTADRFLAVCSPRYFSPEAAHSAIERDYAERLILTREREAAKFMLIVDVKRCANKKFLGDFRYISLYDRTVNEARAVLDEYVGSEPPGRKIPVADDEPDFPPLSQSRTYRSRRFHIFLEARAPSRKSATRSTITPAEFRRSR